VAGLAATTLTAVALAACGADDDDGSSTSAADFRAAVQRLCVADTKAAEKDATPSAARHARVRRRRPLS